MKKRELIHWPALSPRGTIYPSNRAYILSESVRFTNLFGTQ